MEDVAGRLAGRTSGRKDMVMVARGRKGVVTRFRSLIRIGDACH